MNETIKEKKFKKKMSAQLCWKTMDWNDVLRLCVTDGCDSGGCGGDSGKNEVNKRDNELIVPQRQPQPPKPPKPPKPKTINDCIK